MPQIATIAQISRDCEGVCCCRCQHCSGVGYYSHYVVTLPAVDQFLWNGGPDLGALGSMRLAVINFFGDFTLQQERVAPSGLASSNYYDFVPPVYGEYLYGSEGGTGRCVWSYWDEFVWEFSPGNVIRRYIALDITSGVPTLTVRFIFYYSRVGLQEPFATLTFTWQNGTLLSCRTGGASSEFIVQQYAFVGTFFILYPTPFSVNIVPDLTSTWYQCGQNEDGSPVTDPDVGVEALNPLFRALAPGVSLSSTAKPLPIARPERCESFGKRKEFRGGCAGWTCLHDCKLGLPAVPGVYCQTCPKYVADPDAEGRGAASWME